MQNTNVTSIKTFSYLKHHLIPVTKFSFYSGNISFSVAENVVNLYERCKELLDTNGNGWNDPIVDFSKISFKIERLDVKRDSTDNETAKACAILAMNQSDDENDEDMLVPVPKIETESIWLPLKRKRVFNVNSKESSFVLLRYFITVSQCYIYQGINQAVFNRKLKAWIIESVLPFLDDDKLYPAFGAVLRILETIKDPDDERYQGSRGKSASRRNRLNSIRGRIINDDYENFGSDFVDDWWIRVVSIAVAGFLLVLLIIYMCVKLCRKRFYISDRSSKQKNKGLLASNTHIPEMDEYYQYKKEARGVVFENEKQRKSRWFNKYRKSKDSEKFDLPLLGNATDSEDEIVLHDSSAGSKKTAEARGRVNKTKFGISESSDEGLKDGKASKSSLKPPSIKQKDSSDRQLNLAKTKR